MNIFACMIGIEAKDKGETHMEKVIWNGKLMDRSEVKVDMEDRGYQFGDGVYEMLRVYNGRLFCAEAHLNRLLESAKKIRITVPYTINHMKDLLQQLICENNVQLGTVYMQITRGVSARNHVFPSSNTEPVLVAYSKEMARPTEQMKTGIQTMTVEDVRWLKCDIKSLNLLGNVLAKQSAADQGCFEAIQHRSGTVTEGSSSNISIVCNGKVITHPANHLILNGIVRQVMLESCRNNQIPVEERPFTLQELMEAEEAIMTSTTAEIMPIIQVDGKPIGNGCVGKVTQQLQHFYDAEIARECGVSPVTK